MPIYAFACEACGHQFDRLQKMSDPEPETCPQCGAPHPRRQVTAPSFRLAGNGWYETDFKSGSDKKHNLAGDAGETKPAAAPVPAPAPAPASAPVPAPAASDSKSA